LAGRTVTLEALDSMSRSGDRDERLRAAHLAARHDAVATEEVVMRLLRDPGDVAVTAAMATALLEVRREAAIPLILRSLGQDLPAERDERFDQAGQLLLESLLDSELDGVVVRETILAVVLDTADRRKLLGALAAIAWIAPSGGFPAPADARARVGELSESGDETIRGLARDALAALASL
jgi:hypothetical protein